MGNSGSLSGQFDKAIASGNVIAAELAARELGSLDLKQALRLLALVALRPDPLGRRERWTTRWLVHYLDERPNTTINEVLLIAPLLAALGGPAHQTAEASLLAMAETASGGRRERVPS